MATYHDDREYSFQAVTKPRSACVEVILKTGFKIDEHCSYFEFNWEQIGSGEIRTQINQYINKNQWYRT